MSFLQGRLVVDEMLKIGIVTAKFNFNVTELLEKGALDRLLSLGLTSQQIISVRVPGALEIPLAVQTLLRNGCHGVVALGAVIRGETSHYDYVCAGVERGCSHLQLKYKKPVGFGVLTTENEEQALDRAGGAMGNKGAEAAEVVVEMIDLFNLIKSNNPTRR
ncbi:MAG: 6,7-dimethyl-8-ribityllumazine synthase [Bdellovibrionales bacterium]|jgi:6,7-dimethyl-8-ribityllumazine synthase|nr:6,7-dimethyl-8-ribityllumazine synthase [Bdellovibrionales bacterium]